MGLFSRTKKSSGAPTSSVPITKPIKVDSRTQLGLKNHPTGFYKNAPKNASGMPVASRMYWNTNPPTPCPELQQTSVFDAEGNDVELHDFQSLIRGVKNGTHFFNVVHRSERDSLESVCQVAPTPDYSLVRSWLTRCDKEHQQCRVEGNTTKLQTITLIDVRSRKLVRYRPGMQYVALSYVWGGVPSPKRSGPFEFPRGISTTIEHAMIVADKIGIPYLWADAVCINQHDPIEQDEQLPLMDYIYEQAFATIVALGPHANIGLPGVDGGPKRRPQIVAEFGPVKLLSRCPKLESQLEESVWSTRGWTYQEGVFSRRCIFFSQSQVYFHCNTMLCTEDSPTPTLLYPTKNSRNPAQLSSYRATDVTYIRRNTMWTKETNGNIYTYIEYLGQYIWRDVSYDTDAIKAFSALLSRLQRDFFHRGFAHGIPKDDFRNGLLWAAGGKVSRRTAGEFPTWSWAAWRTINSGVTYGLASVQEEPHNHSIPYPLRISLGQECLHDSKAGNTRLSGMSLEMQNLWNAYSRDQASVPMRRISQPPTSSALYIDGPVVALPVTYDPATQVVGFAAPTSLPKVKMIHLWPLPSEKGMRNWQQLPVPTGKTNRRDLLVMQTKYVVSAPCSRVEFTLMLLEWVGEGIAVRSGALRLSIEGGLGQFWTSASVKRNVFWLV